MSALSELQSVSASLAVDISAKDATASSYDALIAACPAGDVNLVGEYTAAKAGELARKGRMQTAKTAVDQRIIDAGA